MYDVIIVGAGPAGLTASIYLKRANKDVLVLESKMPGGKIVNAGTVENYPGIDSIQGVKLGQNMFNQASSMGVKFKFERVTKINDRKSLKEVITDKDTYQAKAVILANGSINNKLGIKGEKEFTGKGVSYCATCDGNFYKGKIVAVVGGGNTALTDALYLANIARKVYLIHRRDEFRGDKINADRVKSKSNIEIILNSQVKTIEGDDKVKSIDIETDGKVQKLDIDGIFIAIGEHPDNDFIKDLVELDKDGYIVSDDRCHTSCPGIFASGDVREKDLRQLVTATSDGAISAMEALTYIDK